MCLYRVLLRFYFLPPHAGTSNQRVSDVNILPSRLCGGENCAWTFRCSHLSSGSESPQKPCMAIYYSVCHCDASSYTQERTKKQKTRSPKPAMPPIRCLVPSPDVTSGCCVFSFSIEVSFLHIFLFLGQMPTVHDEP